MHVYSDPACAGLVIICRLQNEIKRRGTRSQLFKLYEYAMTFSTSISFIRKIGPCTRPDWSISFVTSYFTSKVRKNRASSKLLYKSNRPQVSMVHRLINHLRCWKNTRGIRKSLTCGSWLYLQHWAWLVKPSEQEGEVTATCNLTNRDKSPTTVHVFVQSRSILWCSGHLPKSSCIFGSLLRGI